MGYIRGICISKERGTAKHEVESAKFIPDWGIEGDAHAGHWHRQVSLLSLEKINEFRAKGADVALGAFGENLIVEGFDLRNLPIGTQLCSGDVLLEITQIGKECHSHCEIYKKMGDCIMPREGVFTEVLHGGHIQKGDQIEMIPPEPDRPFTADALSTWQAARPYGMPSEHPRIKGEQKR